MPFSGQRRNYRSGERKRSGFAAGTLGDGIAIRPVENTVSAPLGGTLKVMFHTGHAFVIESEDGQEVMVHVGIDTVKYKGEGFEVLKAQGDRVKPGEVIVRLITVSESCGHDNNGDPDG